MNTLLSAAVLAASSFTVGYGHWDPDAGGMAGLTDDEEVYIEKAMLEWRDCDDQACQERVISDIWAVINLRRDLSKKFRSSILFDAMRTPCESKTGHAELQKLCFEEAAREDFDSAMHAAGFRRSGVTMSGFHQIRTGMQMRELLFILSRDGTEISYTGYGGRSVSSYRWDGRSGWIIVTFVDDEVAGKSQVGLE